MGTRRVLSVVLLLVLTGGALLLRGVDSSAAPRMAHFIARAFRRPAQLMVKGQAKTMPFPTSRFAFTSTAVKSGSAPHLGSLSTNRGIALGSFGCRERNKGRNVRVNQDCSYRAQAEEDIAYNPRDPHNLVAAMNDTITGFNETSLDFSVDGGRHWGSVSTAPFRQRLNAPEDLLPTAGDPNAHTILGASGTHEPYAACSDPYLAFDSEGRAFYTCVAFDAFTPAGLVFAVSSPVGAKGSYFDLVPPPFGPIPREHIIDEENSLGAIADGPKIAADSFRNSPNRDFVYETWTNINYSCGPTNDQFCEAPTYGSMSTDHGFTWSTPEEISGINPNICTLGNSFDPSLDPGSCNYDGHSDIAVRPNGQLEITFQNQNTPDINNQILGVKCSPSGSSPAGTAHLNCGPPSRVAREILQNAPQCDFGFLCAPGAYIRTPQFTSQRIAVDQANGDLYVTWYDYRYGEFDIFVTRSTDGGTNWSRPRKVNPDRGTDHYFAAIDINEHHGHSNVAISYYRTGRVPHENNTPAGGFSLNDPGVGKRLSDYVLSGDRNTNSPFRFRVLSPRFAAPNGIWAGFNGDYSGLAVTPDGDAHPIWSDTRNRVPNPSFNHATWDEDVFTASHDVPRRK